MGKLCLHLRCRRGKGDAFLRQLPGAHSSTCLPEADSLDRQDKTRRKEPTAQTPWEGLQRKRVQMILKKVALNSLSLRSSLSLKVTAIAATFSPSALPSVSLRGYDLFHVKNKQTKPNQRCCSFFLYFGSCNEAKGEPSHPSFTKSGGEKTTQTKQPRVKK